ncbi:MAG: hypothetical protein IH851_05200 [Armatimonadetes bacterium]|nr:hypothetical protein [Armatimonadota bacterium]
MQKLAADFIPAADAVHRLQRGRDPEALLFQLMAEHGHYGGRTVPTDTRQGTYALTPSGRFLASINTNDAKRMAQMLETALATWHALTRNERLMADDPALKTREVVRVERFFPHNGLVLRVFSRDLPRENIGKGWQATAWNQDFAWFKKSEARLFLPQDFSDKSTHNVPDAVARRIARFHLVDNVRGQTSPYDNNALRRASMQMQVTDRKGSIVSIRLEGEFKTSTSGQWSVSGYRDMNKPSQQDRGVEVRLLGRAKYDQSKQRFIEFEMVAIGTRWGGTQYNGRGDDLPAAQIGFAFTLAGDSPSERVTPAHFWGYGWR